MGETGMVQFQGNLDPRAKEYIPHPHVIVYGPLPPPPPAPQFFIPVISPVIPYVVEPFPVARSAESSATSRAVALSGVCGDSSETWVRRELERFGDVRAVQMERLRSEGVVTVHFYDLRSAESALAEIRSRHGCFFFHPSSLIHGRVWAQFVVPALANALPEGHNQGTIVIFNLNHTVTVSTLRDVFKTFGAIKELRETPAKKHQKFVEFFDVRDAARALKEMNGREIHGKPVVIEFSRPGGQCRRMMVNAALTSPRSSSSSLPARSKFFNSPPPNLPPRKLSGNGSQFPARKSNFFPKTWNKDTEKKSSLGHLSSNGSSDKHDVIISPPATVKATVQVRSTRTKKPKHGKKLDSRFLISEEAMSEMSSCKDTRTTVMIKNIPNKYSQKLLLSMLDNHCIHCNKRIDEEEEDNREPYSSYDFVYLPIDFNNKCNVGYGFVNMTSPEATWRLYKAFHLQLWEAFNSRKICEVTYARVQGLEALKEHFKSSKFPCEMEHYLPVVFTPPRDGRQITEPLPIVVPPIGRLSELTPSTSDDDARDSIAPDDDNADVDRD